MLIAGAHADEKLYESPLHLGIESESESVVDVIILLGADPNVLDGNGNTPLICAIDHGRNSMTKAALVAAGPDPSYRAHDGRSALHAAAKIGEDEIVSELLGMRVDMNVWDESRETPLVSAVKAGKSSTAKALLAAGADIKKRDHGGRSALDWAATNALADVVKAFFRHGAEANGCNLLGRTALHWAAASVASIADTEDATKALIDWGADTEFPNELGCTPLIGATRLFNRKSMLALLRNGANANARSSQKNTPLHDACTKKFAGLEAVVDLLLRWGADENARNNDMLRPAMTLGSGQGDFFGCSTEETERTNRLLFYAEHDRRWRRRGWLVMLRSRALEEASGDDYNGGGCSSGGGGGGNGGGDEDEEVDATGRAECLRRRTGGSAVVEGGAGCGSDVRNAAESFSLMEMLPQTQIPEVIFRMVVSFLR